MCAQPNWKLCVHSRTENCVCTAELKIVCAQPNWKLCVHSRTENCVCTAELVTKTGDVGVTWQWAAFVLPLLSWKNYNYYVFWVCLCSFSYPACIAHSLYRHLWPVRPNNSFPHYLTKGTIFAEELLNIKCVFFYFLYNFCVKHFSF